MTASLFRQGAPGPGIRYSVAPCLLGWVLVAATERGICAIEFDDQPLELPARLRRNFPKAQIEEAGAEFAEMVASVIGYIEKPAGACELPLDLQGTAFQQRVWHALRQVPAGETLSYTELATRIGSPKAARAVAGACAANRLAVAIPCHRVIRGDGALSGYRWGIERKRRLLLMEQEQVQEQEQEQQGGGQGAYGPWPGPVV